MTLPYEFSRRNAPEYCPKHGCPLAASGLMLVCPKGCFIVEDPFEMNSWITAKERKKKLAQRARQRERAKENANAAT